MPHRPSTWSSTSRGTSPTDPAWPSRIARGPELFWEAQPATLTGQASQDGEWPAIHVGRHPDVNVSFDHDSECSAYRATRIRPQGSRSKTMIEATSDGITCRPPSRGLNERLGGHVLSRLAAQVRPDTKERSHGRHSSGRKRHIHRRRIAASHRHHRDRCSAGAMTDSNQGGRHSSTQ